MTPERFEALAETYGGDVSRWPAAEREAAALLMAAEPAFAQAELRRAEALDAVLDGWRPVAVSHDLRERVIDGAPRTRRGWTGWIWRAGVGAGLAAACAGGLAVGVSLSGGVAARSDGTELVSAVLASDGLGDTTAAEGA